MAEIPPEVLRRLNDGAEETITLVEWLAIDVRALARAVKRRTGVDLVDDAERLAAETVTRRMIGMGEAVHRAGGAKRLERHPSDMVRAWAFYARRADPDLSLEERLRHARRAAADAHMAVRECAWDSFRPFLGAELSKAVRLLGAWVRDPDANVRRCAVEATRPRGVWTAHLEEMKVRPERGEPLLERVRADPSDYVRKAAANWINDASKSRPDWARALCARWTRESRAPETTWIVHRALRTLRKT
jgi:3-methyladenine DNA glycosylase AlkC